MQRWLKATRASRTRRWRSGWKTRWDKKYFDDKQVDEPFRTDEVRLKNVDGAKLLKDPSKTHLKPYLL